MLQDFICRLEGYKTALLELHWTSNSDDQHKLCEEVLDEVCDFQDSISEMFQADNGRWQRNSLRAYEYEVGEDDTALQELLNDLLGDLYDAYDYIEDDVAFTSEFDDMAKKIKRFIYRSRFEDGTTNDNTICNTDGIDNAIAMAVEECVKKLKRNLL